MDSGKMETSLPAFFIETNSLSCPQAVEKWTRWDFKLNSENSRWKILKNMLETTREGEKGFMTDVSFPNGNSIVWHYRFVYFSSFMFSMQAKHFLEEFSTFFLPLWRISLWNVSTWNLSEHLNVASISGFCWRLKAIKIRKRVSSHVERRNDTWYDLKLSWKIYENSIQQLMLPHAILVTAITTKAQIINLLAKKIWF